MHTPSEQYTAASCLLSDRKTVFALDLLSESHKTRASEIKRNEQGKIQTNIVSSNKTNKPLVFETKTKTSTIASLHNEKDDTVIENVKNPLKEAEERIYTAEEELNALWIQLKELGLASSRRHQPNQVIIHVPSKNEIMNL